MKFSKYNKELRSSSGDEGIRTPDPLLARQVLSQLSYTPISLGLRRLELPTSRLSGVRSNRLSYKPIRLKFFSPKPWVSLFNFKDKFDLASTYSPTPSPVQYHRP